MVELSSYYGLTLGTDVSAEEIKNAVGATEVRVALPNSPLTADYRRTRITIFVSIHREIKKITWG